MDSNSIPGSMKTGKQHFDDTNLRGEVKKQTPRGLMYISSPREILEIIKTIPKGQVITVKQIADTITKKKKVDYTCALTSGIFVSIIANYVEQENIKDVPYWRVVRDKGILYDHYFRLPSDQAKKLASEGWTILKKGSKQIPYIKLD